jgi:hypothetical protein
MPLPLKILAFACVLLLAFAITTALSAFLIGRIIHELGGIVDYHIQLTAFMSEVDVLSFEYELNARPLIEQGVREGDQTRSVVQR